MAEQTEQKHVTIKSLQVFPFILNPVLSLVLSENNANGAKIGVHKHSPVRLNTKKNLKKKFI
jgi:hypothetical protein